MKKDEERPNVYQPTRKRQKKWPMGLAVAINIMYVKKLSI